MASKLPPPTPRPKLHSRAASLHSGGRLTIPRMSDENCSETTQKHMPTERRPPHPTHVQQRRTPAGTRGIDIHDDHNNMKEQLTSPERSKSNVMQDLGRTKRNMDEFTTKLNGVHGPSRKDKVCSSVEMENAVSWYKEGWQEELTAMKQKYESALVELQTSKQAIESLKHELMVCVEAKDEAVRLAGEAMNAAESTARQVKELSAELITTTGSVLAVDFLTSETDGLIGELPGARQSLLEIEVLLEKVPQKTCLAVAEEGKGKDFIESLNGARAEFTDKRVVQVMNQEMQISNISSASKDLQSELDAAKEAEQKALNDVLAMRVNLQQAKLEAENAKVAEQKALNDALSLQANIQQAKLEVGKAKSAESSASSLLDKVSRELEEAEEKLVRVSIEEATVVASLGFLKAELERSLHDLMEARDRETEANSRAAELSACLKNITEESQSELVMYKERETSAHAKIESLQMELGKYELELVMAAKREMVAMTKVADMIGEIKKSRSELIEHQKHSSSEVAALKVKLEENEAKLVTLEERESLSSNKIATLTFNLEKKQSEVGDLWHKLLEMELKAEVVSVELLTSQGKGLHLAAKEEEANTKVAALNAEIFELRKDLEVAINAGQVSRGNFSKHEVALQLAILDRDEMRREVQTAYSQMELNRMISEDALAESQASKDNVDRALEVMHMTSNAAVEEALIASRFAEEEGWIAHEEAHVAEEKLQVAMKQAEVTSADMEVIRKEAQSARDVVDLHKAALEAEERANLIEEEAKVVLIEVVTDLAELQQDAVEARAALSDAEIRLKGTREELEVQKVRAIEAERHAGDVSQEELAGWKAKLHACEEHLKVSRSEVEALQMDKGELIRELEIVKAEREANKRSVLEAHQHLIDLEKAKQIMEADIQRLLDDSKLWKMPKDTRDILVHSEVNGNGYVLTMDFREEKPQPESPDRESLQDLMTMADLPMDEEEKSNEEVAIEKEDEHEAPQEEMPSRVKKKKHALFHRLHSYLDKKKSLNI